MITVGHIIFWSIFLLFAALFGLRVRVKLIMQTDLKVTLYVLGIPIKIVPAKPKKYKLKRYTAKKIQKRKIAAEKKAEQDAIAKAEKAKQKKIKKAEKKARLAAMTKEEIAAKKASKPSIIALIRLGARILYLFLKKFLKHIHIEVAKIHIRIGGQDAASVAKMYGLAYQAVEYMLMVLKKLTHTHSLKHADIKIEPDYLGDDIDVDINVTVSLRLASIIGMLFKIAFIAVVGFLKIVPKKKRHFKHRKSQKAQPEITAAVKNN